MASLNDVVGGWSEVLRKVEDYQRRLTVLESTPAPTPTPATFPQSYYDYLASLFEIPADWAGGAYAPLMASWGLTPTEFEFTSLVSIGLNTILGIGAGEWDSLETLTFPLLNGEAGGGSLVLAGMAALTTVNVPKIRIGSGGVIYFQIDNIATVTTVDMSECTWAAGGIFSATGCALTEAVVNAIFVRAATFLPGITDGTIDFTGGSSAAPTGAGDQAATDLQAAGWVIGHN